MTKARDLGDFISDGTIAETVTADGLDLGDNERIRLGDSQDLQLFHNGSASYITDSGTGNLVLQTSSALVVQNSAGTETMLQAFENGAVNLYHDNTVKLATSATGATVTGTIAVSDSFNATSGTFTVQSNGTDILNLTSTVMSPQTDGAISLGSATNGFNNMYLDGSAYVGGNVGAGTSSPQRQIHSVDSNGEVLRLQRDGAFTGSWDLSIGTQTTGDFTVYDNENSQRAITVEKLTGFTDTSALYINSAGRVGIGSASLGDATLEIQPQTDIPQIKLTQNNVGDGSDGWKFHNSGPTGGNLAFIREASGSDTEYMRITTAGTLQIAGGGNDSVGEINMGNTAQNANRFQVRHQSSAWYLKTVDSEPLAFGTANTERFRIGTSGELGIGGATYGTSGQVLTSGGSGAAPTWTTISAGAPFSGFGS